MSPDLDLSRLSYRRMCISSAAAAYSHRYLLCDGNYGVQARKPWWRLWELMILP